MEIFMLGFQGVTQYGINEYIIRHPIKNSKIYQCRTLQIVLQLKIAPFIPLVLYLWVSMNVGW